MPFDSNSGSKAGKKSKRGPAKRQKSNIKQLTTDCSRFVYLILLFNFPFYKL
jgi:hypothetical protein